VHKLQQAVLNILSNAYKYSPEGGEVAVSFLSHTDEQGRHRHGVRIEDHGVGLSAEDQARLGERFFRVDKSGNIPGTGLGVSIVKELMELMGGRMQVVSALGQGTTVTLWL
jgi:signal transduction histidine kinase